MGILRGALIRLSCKQASRPRREVGWFSITYTVSLHVLFLYCNFATSVPKTRSLIPPGPLSVFSTGVSFWCCNMSTLSDSTGTAAPVSSLNVTLLV